MLGVVSQCPRFCLQAAMKIILTDKSIIYMLVSASQNQKQFPKTRGTTVKATVLIWFWGKMADLITTQH